MYITICAYAFIAGDWKIFKESKFKNYLTTKQQFFVGRVTYRWIWIDAGYNRVERHPHQRIKLFCTPCGFLKKWKKTLKSHPFSLYIKQIKVFFRKIFGAAKNTFDIQSISQDTFPPFPPTAPVRVKAVALPKAPHKCHPLHSRPQCLVVELPPCFGIKAVFTEVGPGFFVGEGEG